jgi:arsenate reductase
MSDKPTSTPLHRRRVLFVCVGNSCRSQLAEAFARKMAADVIEASSAGIHPFGRIADSTQAVGAEFGLSFDGQYSKPIEISELRQADLVVNMSGIESPGLFPGARRIVVWKIDDPFEDTLDVYRRIAREIQSNIAVLAAEFRAAAAPAHEG